MKAMLLSDLTIIKNSSWQQAFLCLVVTAALSFGMSSLYSIIPAAAFFGGMMIVINLAAIDEQNGWEKYRLTLPMSRSQVVLGRYVSSLVIILAYTLLGALLFFLIALAIPVINTFIPINQELLTQAQAIDFGAFAATGVLPTAVLLIFCAIMLPLGIRFGLTSAIRILPIALFWLAIAAFIAIKQLFPSMPPFLNDIITWASSPEGMVVLGLLLVLLAAILYTLSYLIAAKAYRGREF